MNKSSTDPENQAQTPAHGNEQLLGNRYELLEKIGEGGVAEVFRARDYQLDRIVAVKVLRRQFTSDPQSRSRFAVEARAAASLSQPNIVDIYDFGEAPDGSMYIVMQYVEGDNLRDILAKRGRLSPGEAITIASQVCRALSVAHAKGLIHRDVKPQNIMIDRQGNVRLTDFGVVKALSAPSLTQSGMTFGTAAYLSPEQATGAVVGPASDVYALGCVMYEMLSGTPPFVGDNPATVAYKQVWEQPGPLHKLVPEVPPSLETVVMRCLEKDPARRIPTTKVLAGELEKLSLPFNQPTQAMSLGAMAAQGAGEQWTPSQLRPPAQVSQAIPIASSASSAPTVAVGAGAVPPVRAQSTRYPDAGAYGSSTLAPSAPASASTAQPRNNGPARPYNGVPVRDARVISTANTGRNMRWLPTGLASLAVLGLLGFAAWQVRGFFGAAPGDATPTPPVPTNTMLPVGQKPPATPTLGQIIVASPISVLPTPTAISALPTETPQPQATDTPQPPPEPSDTPQPPTEPPATDTPQPPQVEPTDTPEPGAKDPKSPAPFLPGGTPSAGATVLTLDDSAFAGGYTRKDGRYHGRTAHWVYGQGTPYHTMTASFNVDKNPSGPAGLVIVGVDSEDKAKTPIRISLNDTVIYEGPDPLPNDSRGGPDGKGNWGTAFWEIAHGVLQEGTNTLSITNLDPSDKINYPIFFMLDYAAIIY